jgi:hypothetical protein
MLSMLASAGAAEMNLAWSSETIRYHAEVLIQHFNPIEVLAIQNLNVRATTLMAAADLSCSGKALKKGWSVDCSIDTIAMQGEPQYADDMDALNTVLLEYGSILTGALIQIELGADGRIKVVDLEGVDKADERQREIHEKLRLIVRRMVAPLDLQLPKKGMAEAGDSWKHKNSAIAFEIFSKYGTLGGSVLKYSVLSDSPSEVTLAAEGHGNIGLSNSGSTYGFSEGSSSSEASSGSSSTGYASSSVTSTLYNVVAQTAGRFDVATGQWAYMVSTAQGLRNQAVSDDNFTQAAWMGRINADGAVEDPGSLSPE